MSMGTYDDQTADDAGVAALRGAAGDGRAAAMSRRRALAAGRSAPTQGVVGNMPDAIDGMAAGRLGRALAMQRRRQLAKGKQALAGDRSAAAARTATPVLIVHHGGAR
jgi:hypothetical protein